MTLVPVAMFAAIDGMEYVGYMYVRQPRSQRPQSGARDVLGDPCDDVGSSGRRHKMIIERLYG